MANGADATKGDGATGSEDPSTARPLADVVVSSACCCPPGAEEVDEDGFCQGCGLRVRRPAADHCEREVSTALAAVSDRGVRRAHNEDRFQLAMSLRGTAVFVCDGVSSTRSPELAAALVCTVAGASVQNALDGDGEVDPSAVLQEAFTAAAAQLGQHRLARTMDDQQPSTTVVAALVLANRLTVSWAGDSRAYWITLDATEQLTRDHAAGDPEGPLEGTGRNEPLAITRWLGADRDEGDVETIQKDLPGEGYVVLCTDGLWRYLPEAEGFGAMFRQCAAAGRQPLEIAQALVAFANRQGGHDNITVAVLHVPAAAGNEAAGDKGTKPKGIA